MSFKQPSPTGQNLSVENPNKLVVVDLDGTFIHSNSFRLFILFLLRESLRERKLLGLFHLVLLMFLRTVRLYSHSRLKFVVLKHFTPLHSEKINTFVNSLGVGVNKRVREFLRKCKNEGMAVCLATAAPAFYANGMRQFFDFDFVLGTSTPENDHSWVENIRGEKLRSVNRLATREGLTIHTVISNHFDDLPLFEICRNPILVGASSETIVLLAQRGIMFQQLQ
jgi:phosphoserine phosphatase